MCGIVGYIGNKREVKDVLTTSLKRLEHLGFRCRHAERCRCTELLVAAG